MAYFISPDSIVPGDAVSTGGGGGTLGQGQNSKLTVDFHEREFAPSVARENMQIVEQGFWFQLSGREKGHAKYQWGPKNPQALNRYSCVLDNPLRYVDPTDHSGAVQVIPLDDQHPLWESSFRGIDGKAYGTERRGNSVDVLMYLSPMGGGAQTVTWTYSASQRALKCGYSPEFEY